jgi:hypothetical protein
MSDSDLSKQDEELEYYSDGITSKDEKVSLFLKTIYITLPIWGVISFYFFWNGSSGWLDRGYWHELQIAANTTFPIQNLNSPPLSETPGTKE